MYVCVALLQHTCLSYHVSLYIVVKEEEVMDLKLGDTGRVGGGETAGNDVNAVHTYEIPLKIEK